MADRAPHPHPSFSSKSFGVNFPPCMKQGVCTEEAYGSIFRSPHGPLTATHCSIPTLRLGHSHQPHFNHEPPSSTPPFLCTQAFFGQAEVSAKCGQVNGSMPIGAQSQHPCLSKKPFPSLKFLGQLLSAP